MRVYEVRRRPRLRLVLPLVVLLVLAGLVYLVAAKMVVVPGVTARLYPIHYQEGIARVAEKYGLDPYLVAAVVRTESDFDPKAVSRAGAVGLMQLMPDTAAWVVELSTWKGKANPKLTDPADNLELGACYLAFLQDRFGSDGRAAIAAYNAGQGVVSQWLADTDGHVLKPADIPFAETRTFVERVERWEDLYRRAHPGLFE